MQYGASGKEISAFEADLCLPVQIIILLKQLLICYCAVQRPNVQPQDTKWIGGLSFPSWTGWYLVQHFISLEYAQEQSIIKWKQGIGDRKIMKIFTGQWHEQCLRLPQALVLGYCLVFLRSHLVMMMSITGSSLWSPDQGGKTQLCFTNGSTPQYAYINQKWTAITVLPQLGVC